MTFAARDRYRHFVSYRESKTKGIAAVSNTGESSLATTYDKFTIGANTANSGWYRGFLGLIYHVIVWDRALSAGDLTTAEGIADGIIA